LHANRYNKQSSLPAAYKQTITRATRASTSGLPGEPRAGRTLVCGPLYPSSYSSYILSSFAKAVCHGWSTRRSFDKRATQRQMCNLQATWLGWHVSHLPVFSFNSTKNKQRYSNAARSFSYFPCISSTVPVFLEQHAAYPAKLGPTPLGCPRIVPWAPPAPFPMQQLYHPAFVGSLPALQLLPP
jgi:hypothetical protein